MGRNKALVGFHGRPLVMRIVERLAATSDDVFVVARERSDLAVLGPRVYTDACDVRTPLAGIITALRVASHPLVFVCATDMPHVSTELIGLLASRASSADVVVPERDGDLEPLHAMWSTSVADDIARAIDGGERAVHGVLARLNVVTIAEDEWRAVDPSGASFTNLNTPDELLAARP